MPAIATAPRVRRPVKPGETLDYAGLQRAANKAVKDSGRTQASIAAALEVTPPAVNHALKNAGGRYAAMQMRIIEEASSFRIEDRTRTIVEFRVAEKPAGYGEGA